MNDKEKNIIKLIAFLGNPGSEYSKTRHNVGRMIAEQFSMQLSLSWQKKFKGVYSQINKNGIKIYLLQPDTYMNKSGESIKPCADYFNIVPEKILVVHDEIELPFGTIDIKQGGGLGGHNGLRSIVQHLGTKDFFRLRIGVSRPQFGDVASYVLSNFSGEEKLNLHKIIIESELAIKSLLFDDLNQAVKRYKKIFVLTTSDKK